MKIIIKLFVVYAVILLGLAMPASGFQATQDSRQKLHFYKPSDIRVQYTGRVDFTNPSLPRFWAPGVYIKIAFQGPFFDLLINDENKWGGNNYISVSIDDLPVKRIKLSGKSDTLSLGEGLDRSDHVITICKSTESSIGYLELVGFWCKKLISPPPLPKYKMEFIGNSITCGTGSDQSGFACGNGEWYDQHNAFLSYGPLTARALDAQWQLTAVSGIGLTHSCCGGKLIMPDVFDKVNMSENSIIWNFKNFQPDVVTVCLGQNDGVVEADLFCTAYVSFLQSLRRRYPNASFICLTSPMADENLSKVQKGYLERTVKEMNAAGDEKVYRYFFSKRYQNGCGGHPDLKEHQQIAAELTGFIRTII